MCGIFAAIHSTDVDQEAADRADRALRLLEERGPHGSARMVDDGALLGLARLAIVAPRQEARVDGSADGHVLGVMNGEIYQHRALRAGLGVDDDASDQAVAVALFARGGVAALASVHGPVTAAFLDRPSRTLTLMRDRFGKRPLFVDVSAADRGQVSAASEMKALAATRRAPLRFSRIAIARFLARGILEDDTPLVAGIESVPPGSAWRVDASGRIERGVVERAGIESAGVESDGTSRGDAMAGRRALDVELLRAACARRLEGLEVDAAVLLSGGLDSSVVCALSAHRHLPAYTMRIRSQAGSDPWQREQGSARDESEKARQVAEALGVEHRVVDVEPPTLADLAACAWRLESPDAFVGFGVAHAYATLARRLRADGVRVVVTGEGADELFMGYPWQRAQAAAHNGWSFADAGVNDVEEGPWAAASLASPRTSRALEVFLRARFGAPLSSIDALSLCRQEALADAIDVPAVATARHEEMARARGAERRRFESLRIDMPMWPLRIADRMLMGGGVEPRAPFLDDEVVDAALALPAASFESAHEDKPGLRSLARALLPHPAARKQGFGAWSWPGAATSRQWARALARDGTTLVRDAALHELAGLTDDRSALLSWRLVLLEVTARQLEAARGGAPWQP